MTFFINIAIIDSKQLSYFVIEYVQTGVGNFTNELITLLECGAVEESFKNTRLEVLDQLQLSPPLHLKTLGQITLEYK